MSWEHEWPLTVWPTRGEVERAIEEVCGIANVPPPTVSYERWDDEDREPRSGFGVERADDVLAANTIICLAWKVRVDEAIDVVLRLDPTADREMLARDLELPRGDIDWAAAERAGFVTIEGNSRSLDLDVTERFTRRPNHYCVTIELVAPNDDEEDPACVRIYSNEYNNREAGGMLGYLAGELATRLERLSAFS